MILSCLFKLARTQPGLDQGRRNFPGGEAGASRQQQPRQASGGARPTAMQGGGGWGSVGVSGGRTNRAPPQVPACTVAPLQMFTLDQTGGQLVAIDPLPANTRASPFWEKTGRKKPHMQTGSFRGLASARLHPQNQQMGKKKRFFLVCGIIKREG